MASSAKHRLLSEISELRRSPLEHISAGPVADSNLFVWAATLTGPPDTPYVDGLFSLAIDVPEEYPFSAPKIRFTTPIYHPNISRDGTICLNVLYSKWSPALTIGQLLLSILCLLASPNGEHGMEPDIVLQFNEDPARFRQTAQEWTKKWAMK